MRYSFFSACVSVLFVFATDSVTAEEATTFPADLPLPSVAPQPDAAPDFAEPRAATRAVGALPRPGAMQRVQLAPHADARMTNQTRQALAFYGGYSARATLSQLPRRTRIQPAPVQPMQRQLKPFQSLEAEPTLSPYLNLDREETAEDLPNYHTFVLPEFQRRDANAAQHRTLQRLQQQLNNVSTTVVSPQYGQAGTPGMGASARFMDTAQFYGGWRR